MRIPAAEADGDEADAGLDQPSRSQNTLAERSRSVALAQCGRLPLQVEGFLGLVRTQDLQGLLVESIQPFDKIGRFIKRSEGLIETPEESVTFFQFRKSEAARQLNAADTEPAFAAAFDDERVVGGAEVASDAAPVAAQVAEADVGRNALLCLHQLRGQRSHRGIIQ